jgi:hypothetical protein
MKTQNQSCNKQGTNLHTKMEQFTNLLQISLSRNGRNLVPSNYKHKLGHFILQILPPIALVGEDGFKSILASNEDGSLLPTGKAIHRAIAY